MIAESIDLHLVLGDTVHATHFCRATEPDSVVLLIEDTECLAMAEMTMSEAAALREALSAMCERGAGPDGESG